MRPTEPRGGSACRYRIHSRTFWDTDGRTFLKASSKFCLFTVMSTGPEEKVGPVGDRPITGYDAVVLVGARVTPGVTLPEAAAGEGWDLT